MYTIAKRFSFSASHRLTRVPEGHKCQRLHGHNYEVEVVLRSAQLDEQGFVVDYGDLSALEDYIDRHLDHRHLNDVLAAEPTAENLAHHLFDVACELWRETHLVRVWETPTTWAEYQPG